MDTTLEAPLHLQIEGIVSLASSDFRRKLGELEDARANVFIDLSGVQAMESAAIGALMRLRTKLEKRGYRCRFEARLPGLRRILHAANADLAAGVA